MASEDFDYFLNFISEQDVLNASSIFSQPPDRDTLEAASSNLEHTDDSFDLDFTERMLWMTSSASENHASDPSIDPLSLIKPELTLSRDLFSTTGDTQEPASESEYVPDTTPSVASDEPLHDVTEIALENTDSTRSNGAASVTHRYHTRQSARSEEPEPSHESDYESDFLDSPSTRKRGRAGGRSPRKRPRCEVPGCGMTFTRPADVRRHVDTIHKQELLNAYQEAGEKRVWCKSCKWIFTRADARRRHENHGSCQRSQKLRDSRRDHRTVHGWMGREKAELIERTIQEFRDAEEQKEA
ncbi:hypothetical protein SCLCIDRAFT_1221720 [Scleroderma citrinum Foug A]|uniref:C2H2-type domain-containing protein n=1 Tax=Scleroderma citrinum Foug A TaxID=1036808 RepID=A0A0C3D1K2_9AGAM|nr:hypothetical protein SCLCIDRAFT_1221720 [Scleroderma citrinum Foug A]